METEKGQITRIYNGEIITPERNFGVGTVLIAEGKIIGIEPGNYEVPGSVVSHICSFICLPAICTSRESQIIRSLGFHWKICQMPDIVIRWSWINTCGVELWISHVNTM